MKLEHAERGGLLEYPEPCCRIELVGATVELEGIGAVRTRERTAVGQLIQKSQWQRLRHRSTKRRFARSMRSFSTSAAMRPGSAGWDRARSSTSSATVSVPSQRRRISMAEGLGATTRSGASSTI